MEALERYRTGGEQKVTVQHVSVRDGGQAIVGNVTHRSREAPPHKSAASRPLLTDAKTAPMPIIDETKRGSRSSVNRAILGRGFRASAPAARTRSGKLCRSPAVTGKEPRGMHGGSPGSGAPRGNKNALEHGFFTREAIVARRQLRELLRHPRKAASELGDDVARSFDSAGRSLHRERHLATQRCKVQRTLTPRLMETGDEGANRSAERWDRGKPVPAEMGAYRRAAESALDRARPRIVARLPRLID
jgi:hypothetical protein